MSLKEEFEKTGSLPEGIVTVKFIPRKKGMAANVPDNHVIAGGMLSKAVKKFCAPLQRNGSIANILTSEEKEYLEEKTGLNLSVYDDFWKTYSVRLFKEDANNKFDLQNPMDYISIRVLEAWSDDIAKSWSERNNKPSYQFAITREGELYNEKKAKLDVKKEAFKAYGKIEDDREKLLSVLKLLTNKPISKDSKLDWIQGQVEEYVDNKPEGFLDIVNDKSFETKALISSAVDKGIILNKGGKYVTVDGLDLSEEGESPVYANAIKYLENPKHQEVRLLIEAKLEK
jgi:hypothetical protein